MAEPGDHTHDANWPDPDPSPDLHDDLVGFTSPAALSGRAAPRPAPRDLIEPDTAPFPTEIPGQATQRVEPATPERAEPIAHEPAPIVPSWAVETPAADLAAHQAATSSVRKAAFGRKSDATPPVEGATRLFAVYALILFAVPTFGASAAIALLAVYGRSTLESPIARSHLQFQQRTLWAGAVAAIAGVLLIALNVGVLVLFLLAIWIIARGAWGVLTLASGRAIDRPGQWLIGGNRK